MHNNNNFSESKNPSIYQKISRQYLDKLYCISVSNPYDNKYKKWIMFMKYLIPIIYLYTERNDNVGSFIKLDKSIRVKNGIILYYKVLIPSNLSGIDFSHLSDISEYIKYSCFVVNNHLSIDAKIIKKFSEIVNFTVCIAKSHSNNNYGGVRMSDKNSTSTFFCWSYNSKNFNNLQKNFPSIKIDIDDNYVKLISCSNSIYDCSISTINTEIVTNPDEMTAFDDCDSGFWENTNDTCTDQINYINDNNDNNIDNINIEQISKKMWWLSNKILCPCLIMCAKILKLTVPKIYLINK
jgi:hypothetical protein